MHTGISIISCYCIVCHRSNCSSIAFLWRRDMQLFVYCVCVCMYVCAYKSICLIVGPCVWVHLFICVWVHMCRCECWTGAGEVMWCAHTQPWLLIYKLAYFSSKHRRGCSSSAIGFWGKRQTSWYKSGERVMALGLARQQHACQGQQGRIRPYKNARLLIHSQALSKCIGQD